MTYEPKYLYWDESMKTGDESIDFQHKYLLDIIGNKVFGHNFNGSFR
ncbi:MAG: hypothetical protein Fur002_22760 [Anaerolineales bacterium]